jgi:N-methylhydantoinase A
LPARIVWRPGLSAGSVVEGPAVIEEPNSTILVYPGDVAVITEHGHVDIALATASFREQAA